MVLVNQILPFCTRRLGEYQQCRHRGGAGKRKTKPRTFAAPSRIGRQPALTSLATSSCEAALLTVELSFNGKKPPESITLQGAHDFNSGNETGSVSAASDTFKTHIGKEFKRHGDVLTIQ
jgi:hypothetical protein